MPSLLADALDYLVPTVCAGCGVPGSSVCDTCRAALVPRIEKTLLPDGLPVWAAGRYRSVLRRTILAYKDHGRTDCAGVLAAMLRPAVTEAARAASMPVGFAGASGPDGRVPASDPGGTGSTAGRAGMRLAIIPSTRAAFRRRGYRPMPLLLSAAGLRAAPVLHAQRQSRDQAGLGLLDRRLNRAGSLLCRARLDGSAWLVVDDVVTSGASAQEAARALRAAGGAVLGVACVARTSLHTGVVGTLGPH